MTWRWPWQRAEKRSWRLSQLNSWADLGIGDGPTAAGVAVTPETALSVPAVFACCSVLSQDVAKTPVKIRERVGPDTFEDAVDHDLYEILTALPNPETSAYTFLQSLMFDLLAHERAFAEIVRDTRGAVTALWRLDPTRMVVDRDGARRKRYRYSDGGRTSEWTFDPSQPPILDLSHPSPIRHCRELIGTALALQNYVGRFFANGARPGGILTIDDPDLDDDQIQQIGKRWHEGQSGRNAHKIAVLANGTKYQSITSPNDSSQLNETMLTLSTQIAGSFRVPPTKIGDLTKANYSNMEAGENAYVNGTLDPFFVAFEHAFRRDLLTTRQYRRFDIRFDRSTLIRSDIKALHEALARGRDAGFYSANDVRRKLGENPIPPDQGGDLYLANANLKPLGEAPAATDGPTA